MALFAEIGAIEVDGHRATARVFNCREILLLKDGGVRKVVGIYDDALVGEGKAWRFGRRAYQLFMGEGRVAFGQRAVAATYLPNPYAPQ